MEVPTRSQLTRGGPHHDWQWAGEGVTLMSHPKHLRATGLGASEARPHHSGSTRLRGLLGARFLSALLALDPHVCYLLLAFCPGGNQTRHFLLSSGGLFHSHPRQRAPRRRVFCVCAPRGAVAIPGTRQGLGGTCNGTEGTRSVLLPHLKGTHKGPFCT